MIWRCWTTFITFNGGPVIMMDHNDRISSVGAGLVAGIHKLHDDIEQSFASARVQVSFFDERSIFFVAVMTSCSCRCL